MAAAMDFTSSNTSARRKRKDATEYTPLVSHLSHKEAITPLTYFNHFFTPFRLSLFLVMVAIPTALLAVSAFSSLQSLNLHERSTQTTTEVSHVALPEPQVSLYENEAAKEAFNSLLGPLISTNFPDPGIIYHEGVSYAFSTNNRKPPPDLIHAQVATSHDNKTWTLLETHDAMPKVAGWQTGRGVWAPDVVRLDNGKFIMYYSDNLLWAPNHHCVGAAMSDNVMGPYVPLDQPIACPDPKTKGGAIDPEGFYDRSTGKRYLIYKTDGNSLGHGGRCSNDVAPIMPTPIMLQEVDKDDGITVIGDPVEILDRDAQDGPLIEAPAMHRSDEGIYFLFFSSDCFTTPKYDTSFATATNIKGPYTKSGRPLFVTGDGPDLVGPGGMDIIADGELILFHGHMTMDNDAARKEQYEAAAKAADKPVSDIHLPLVRGMYSGIATFSGHDVSLRKISK